MKRTEAPRQASSWPEPRNYRSEPQPAPRSTSQSVSRSQFEEDGANINSRNSSRRDDGLYTKPYFTHVDSEGNATKPFLLPQKDPAKYYKRLMKSYNLPAFTTDKVSVSKRSLTDVLRKSSGTDVKVK